MFRTVTIIIMTVESCDTTRRTYSLIFLRAYTVAVMYDLYSSTDRNVVPRSSLIVILRRIVARVSMCESKRVLGWAVQGATEEERRGQQRSGRV